MSEVWRSIKNHPMYEVSNKGQVRSFYKNYLGKPQTLKTEKSGAPYHHATLYTDRKRYEIKIHILVLEAFVGPRPKGFIGNHKDGDKANDEEDNLEWISKSDDANHAYQMGLRVTRDMRGEKHSQTKLKDNDVMRVKKLLAKKIKVAQIARMFRTTRCIIYEISAGRSWNHIKLEEEIG